MWPETKKKMTDHMIMARKKKTLCCASHRSPKRRPLKLVSENFQYPYTIFAFCGAEWEKSLEEKHKEQSRIIVDGTKQTVHTADNKNFQRKLLLTPIEFHRSPEKDMSPFCLPKQTQFQKIGRNEID